MMLFSSPRRAALSLSLAAALPLMAPPAIAADSNRNLSLTRPATFSESRVALVIGNSGYKTQPLANPVNDARAVSNRLRSLGFTVIERENLGVKQIGATLREFRSRLAPGGVALFFYAGHGVQVQGSNFLPAVDADISSEEDVSLQSLEVAKVLQVMEDAKTRLNLVFLDACRNNPYARSFRAAGGGLARINAPSGTLISFATRPGSVASDGAGKNGLYTEKLLQAMEDTGTPIELLLKRVVSGVKSTSGGKQEPWMEGSIEGDFCFGACSTYGAAPAATPPSAIKPTASGAQALEVSFWESVRDGGRAELLAYLDKYPNGQFAGLAKSKLERLQRELVQLIEAAPKPIVSAPLTRSPAGLPMLYASAIPSLKAKLTPPQAEELLAIYRRDAEAGNAIAQFSLGTCLNFGLGSPENPSEALAWYRRAADQNLSVAQNNYGNALVHGLGVAKDEKEGLRWIRLSADQGNPIAQMNLGVLHYAGQGVPKDPAEAVSWLRKASNQGLPGAMSRLALAYQQGQGVEKDEAEALRLMRKAVEGGDAYGQSLLGDVYRTGSNGQSVNFAEAFRLYQLAAAQGQAMAMNNVGYLYEGGQGTSKDRAKAIEWYRKAAAKGLELAKTNLKRLGETVP